MRKIFFTLAALLICVCGMSQTLVFHLNDGTTYTADVTAALSITTSGSKFVIKDGGLTKELPMNQVTNITGTGFAGHVKGDVNGDSNVDVADIATIIDIMAESSGSITGDDTAPGTTLAIDLGLPSGTLWANMNVGAEKPEDYGLFFAWGETTGYGTDTTDGHNFDWVDYQWYAGTYFKLLKYNTSLNFGTTDNKTELELDDDAAHVNWGGDWRMPTRDDVQELIDNTTSTLYTYNGVTGVKFTSNINGNSIFLPISGYRQYGDPLYQDSKGYYWTSTLHEGNPKYAYGLFTTSAGTDIFGYERSNGLNVRPIVKPCTTLDVLTGEATKVGGSSGTLFGSIDFPTDIYNIYGTYGIIVDKDRDNMLLADAEFQGTGSQPNPGTSYSVDFRGFEPNTTYYYRAYYKFNDDDHGDICPRYVEVDGIAYGEIKSFTTGDNILTVDVAMCIDVTGSMSTIINTVKANAKSFYDQFKQCCDDNGIQLAGLNAQVIAYRDKHNKPADWLQKSSTYSLPSQQAAFDSFVSGLKAEGGGDEPESGLEALQEAFNKSDWGPDDGYHRQVIILWTDAPYLEGAGYSDVTLSDLESQWNTMPSGRRMILFARNTTASHGGVWSNLDGWTNVIHVANEADINKSFEDMNYILESIVGELTSRARVMMSMPIVEDTEASPNE